MNGLVSRGSIGLRVGGGWRMDNSKITFGATLLRPSSRLRSRDEWLLPFGIVHRAYRAYEGLPYLSERFDAC